jgi:hypothetical protein
MAMLSAEERKALDSIEAALTASDPRWAGQFTAHRPLLRYRLRRAAVWCAVVLGWVALFAAGLVLRSSVLVTVAVTVLVLSPGLTLLAMYAATRLHRTHKPLKPRS